MNRLELRPSMPNSFFFFSKSSFRTCILVRFLPWFPFRTSSSSCFSFSSSSFILSSFVLISSLNSRRSDSFVWIMCQFLIFRKPNLPLWAARSSFLPLQHPIPVFRSSSCPLLFFRWVLQNKRNALENHFSSKSRYIASMVFCSKLGTFPCVSRNSHKRWIFYILQQDRRASIDSIRSPSVAKILQWSFLSCKADSFVSSFSHFQSSFCTNVPHSSQVGAREGE